MVVDIDIVVGVVGIDIVGMMVDIVDIVGMVVDIDIDIVGMMDFENYIYQ
jgi:hypothetical protein